LGALSNSTRAIMGGGYGPTNVIDYVEISSLGNAADFGDLTISRYALSGAVASPTRGVFGSGVGASPFPQLNTIDFITIASVGNATDFGDMTTVSDRGAASSSSTRGVFSIGRGPGAVTTNVIEFITIASAGNATDFGDLTQARSSVGGLSNSIRGLFASGVTPTLVNTIDFVTIASAGNATDFGDLTTARANAAGASNGGGGLNGATLHLRLLIEDYLKQDHNQLLLIPVIT
jgi:hypothetical protein